MRSGQHEGQNLALQIDARHKYGVATKLICTDKASGAKHQRPGLDAYLKEVGDGDNLTAVCCGAPGDFSANSA